MNQEFEIERLDKTLQDTDIKSGSEVILFLNSNSLIVFSSLTLLVDSKTG